MPEGSRIPAAGFWPAACESDFAIFLFSAEVRAVRRQLNFSLRPRDGWLSPF
jgi:hypothetical protein